MRNACVYSSDPACIHVSIELSSVIITDNGKGMTAEQLKHIMEPFYRADEHGEEKGFGLGLSIVDMICQQCGWQIKFESEVGRGSKAILTLANVEILASARKNEA